MGCVTNNLRKDILTVPKYRRNSGKVRMYSFAGRALTISKSWFIGQALANIANKIAD
jgi:hypothetical protein